MTIYEYINKNLPNLNWNILPQIFESEGVELTEDIEKYLRETPGNTNKKVLESLLTITEPIEEVYRTVLYTDGTLIINESSRDEAANVALHGQPTNVYDSFDPNGATDADKYIFDMDGGGTAPPWITYNSEIKAVEIGSTIQPTSTANWFKDMEECTSIDLTNLNTNAVTNMSRMFINCYALTNLDLSNFNTSAVTDMSYMFSGCSALMSLDLSNFNTSAVTNMSEIFSTCYALTSLDLSNFNTSAVTDMSYMFSDCNELTTIYASTNFVVSQVTSSDYMFYMSTSLVGGAGTVWSENNPTDKTYAHIDGGVSDPGYFTVK